MKLRLHGFESASRANGPGLRAVVWFQGCTLDCPGCFNPETHNPEGGYETDIDSFFHEIISSNNPIEGVSFSGGEPLQQPEALLYLLKRIRRTKLSVLVFSGYMFPEIEKFPLGECLLQHIDVLIAGRYIQSQHLGHSLLGSSNQKIHLLTNRYHVKDFENIPEFEAIIHRDGTITITGIGEKFKAGL